MRTALRRATLTLRAAQGLPQAPSLRPPAALRCGVAGPPSAAPRLFSSMSATAARVTASEGLQPATQRRVPPHRAHFAGGRGLGGLPAPAVPSGSTPVHARAASSAAAAAPVEAIHGHASRTTAAEAGTAYAPAWLAAFVSTRGGCGGRRVTRRQSGTDTAAPRARASSTVCTDATFVAGGADLGVASALPPHVRPVRGRSSGTLQSRVAGGATKLAAMGTPPPARGVPRYYSSTSLRSDASTRSMGTATPHAVALDRLDHLVLTVADVDRTVEFYESVLGMVKSEFVGTDGTRRLALEFGRQKINLHQHKNEFEPKAANVAPGSADLCFIARTPIDSVAEHVRACGVEITDGPIKRTGAVGPIMSIYMRDPDGNLIEVSNYLEAEASDADGTTTSTV